MLDPQNTPASSDSRNTLDYQRVFSLLSPRTFHEFIGQERIKQHLDVAVRAARLQGGQLRHILICGRHGLGKATLARIITAELNGTAPKITSGPALCRPTEVISMLTNVQRGDVLFVDEIDRIPAAAWEYLRPAMLDFCIDVVMGSGTHANSLHMEIQPFTVIGTTIRMEKVAPDFLSCFSEIENMEDYTSDDLAAIAVKFAKLLEYGVDAEAASQIARSTDGTPLGVLRRLRHVHDVALLRSPTATITAEVAADALKMLPPTGQANASQRGREAIPSAVRREVWRRDGGKCAQCGSRENLEYDHIIPISKGGSSTARNVELLCEKCNRSKRDSIQ